MARAITRQDEDSFRERLLKHIPSEIIGVYLAVNGMLSGNENTPSWIYWIIFGVLVILCPIWLRFGQNVLKWWQLMMSTIAFIIWSMTMPGAWDIVPYAAVIGGALVVIYSGIIAPIVAKNTPKQQ